MMHIRRQSLCVAVILSIFLICSHVADSQVPVAAHVHFNAGGISGVVFLNQKGSDVSADFNFYILSQFAWWQIHELPVDTSIDHKLRCRPEHVGQKLHSGRLGDYIYNVTATSLVMHSIVLLVNDERVACGTIHLDIWFNIPATIEFRSGVFGRIFIMEYPNQVYIVGSIQTEREFECENNEATSYISIVIHNATLGPFDTVSMMHGCSGLEGGTTILEIDVNCMSAANFSQQISKSGILSSYVSQAVSVQNSSGTILGCGRFETHFPVYASYNGKIIFSQYSRYHLTTFVDVAEPDLDILQYNVLEGIAGTCSSKAVIFDPWNPLAMKLGFKITTSPDQFPVGDLSNRQVGSHYLSVPLIGSSTILGHAINDSKSECKSLELSVPESEGNFQLTVSSYGHTMKGYSVFAGPTLTGRITFTQGVYFLPEWILGPTIITVNLSYADSTQATIGHRWTINEGFTDGNGICTNYNTIGALYNPYAVKTTVESGYTNDCNSQRQLRCAMGDLSGKLGTLQLEPVTTSTHQTYSFYDENLFLTGPYTIFGRSIVVYGTGKQRGEPLGCANIEPLFVVEVEISFPKNDSNPKDIDRVEMGHSLSSLAGVPLGDVLVNDVQAVNISGKECLTASLWITGVNAMNATENAGKVSTLDQQNFGKYSAGPCVPPPNKTMGPTDLESLGSKDSNIIISVLVGVLILSAVGIVIGALLIVAIRRKQQIVIYAVEGQEGTREYSQTLVKLLPSKADQWELLGSHFKVGSKLGEGNYGQVYKGTLSMDVAMAPAKKYIMRQTRDGKSPYTVAIKLLKGGAAVREVENFLEEIAMMKKVSSGECCHVVQMVGCVSTALPLALALEFVPFGDLLSYLKYWRQKPSVETLPMPGVHPSFGYDQLYCKEDEKERVYSAAVMEQESIPGTEEVLYKTANLDQKEKCTVVSKESLSKPCLLHSSSCDKPYPKEDREEQSFSKTTQDLESFFSPLGEPDLRDLPSFAYQISLGMEYLSSLGVLHRDLACRNILVDERKLLKISDFGLSRDTPEYVSSLQDKMPLRWMAPETVTENVCTDKSDVWSFGVCLWEIYTLGGIPYEYFPMATLMAQIISGYRLHMPELASEKVYQLMLLCWSSEPESRLNFTQLKFFFKSIITAANKETNYITIQP